MMDGEFLFFVALFLKSEQKAFSGWIIGFDLQPYDGADRAKVQARTPSRARSRRSTCVKTSIESSPKIQRAKALVEFSRYGAALGAASVEL